MNSKHKFLILIVVSIITSFLTTFFYNLIFSSQKEVIKIINDDNNNIELGDTSLSFDSGDVNYDNTASGIKSNNVKGAIDELYACASDYSTYDTRLSDVENNKSNKSNTVSNVSWDSTNKKITKTINGTTTDVVTASSILGNLTKSQVTTALGYTPPTQDTWRGIQNSLTSTSTSDCLSAAQGKALNEKIGLKVLSTEKTLTSNDNGSSPTGLSSSSTVVLGIRRTDGGNSHVDIDAFNGNWWATGLTANSSVNIVDVSY